MNSFRPVIISRKSGRHEPTVTLGRQLMLPTWDVDFGNGYRYLLIYYDKAWGAIDAPGYSTPTRDIVLALAGAIIRWAVANAGQYTALVNEVGPGIVKGFPHPTVSEFRWQAAPKVHMDLSERAAIRAARG